MIIITKRRMPIKRVTAQRSKKMKNVAVRRQTVQNPESRDDATPGKARAQVFQVPADEQKVQWISSNQSRLTSTHCPSSRRQLGRTIISKTIPSPVNSHSTGWVLEIQSHWSINPPAGTTMCPWTNNRSRNPPVGTTMCPWTSNRSRPSGIKNGMHKWPGLKSADLDSSDKWQKWLSKTGHSHGL